MRGSGVQVPQPAPFLGAHMNEFTALLMVGIGLAIMAYRRVAREADEAGKRWRELHEKCQQFEIFYFSVAGERPQFDDRQRLIFDYAKDKGCYVAPAEFRSN